MDILDLIMGRGPLESHDLSTYLETTYTLRWVLKREPTSKDIAVFMRNWVAYEVIITEAEKNQLPTIDKIKTYIEEGNGLGPQGKREVLSIKLLKREDVTSELPKPYENNI